MRRQLFGVGDVRRRQVFHDRQPHIARPQLAPGHPDYFGVEAHIFDNGSRARRIE
jgi:hypothetical protein